MISWSFLNHFREPLDECWEELAKVCLGPKVHPERKKGFILSRKALRKSLLELGVEISVENLRLHGHSELPLFPQFTLSLSHTQDAAAALVSSKDQFLSVGVDLENRDRKVQNVIIQRISHPEDLRLNKLELWCLKEAIFKALMNSGQFTKIIEFSSILVQKDKWSHPVSGLKGRWELKEESTFLIAFSYLDLIFD